MSFSYLFVSRNMGDVTAAEVAEVLGEKPAPLPACPPQISH